MDDMKLAVFLLSAVALFAGLLDASGASALDGALAFGGALGCAALGRLLWQDAGK